MDTNRNYSAHLSLCSAWMRWSIDMRERERERGHLLTVIKIAYRFSWVLLQFTVYMYWSWQFGRGHHGKTTFWQECHFTPLLLLEIQQALHGWDSRFKQSPFFGKFHIKFFCVSGRSGDIFWEKIREFFTPLAFLCEPFCQHCSSITQTLEV